MMRLSRLFDRAVVHLVRWRCEQLDPRRGGRDFMDALKPALLAEAERRRRIALEFGKELDARDSAFAHAAMLATAREQFETLASGSPGLQ